MQLTDGAIRRPRATGMLAIVLVCWGLWALKTTPIEKDPRIRIPLIIVVVPYPGAAPDEVEDQVTRRIEQELRGLTGVDRIESTSGDSAAVIIVQFTDDVRIKDARRDVQQAVDQVRGELPDEVETPLVRDVALENLPIIQISLYGPLTLPALERLARRWRDPIEAVPGVRQVEIFGGLTREVIVEGDPGRLSRYGLTLEALSRAIAAQHRNLPGGAIDLGTIELRVRTLGQFERPDAIRDAMARPGAEPLRVADVAQVEPEGHARIRSISRINGLPGVTLLVRPQTEINTLETVDAIKATAARLERSLPAGVGVSLTADQSREIGYMVEQLTTSAWLGSLLVMCLLLWAIGARNALLVGMAIPGSLLVGFVFLQLAGIALSGVAIFALILILGMVVDGAIIVGENIYRHIELGVPRQEAAIRGMHEIGVSILTADLTTISAFLPLLFVGGVTGQFMAVMPKVVAFTLCGSMIIDHFVLPAAAALVMRAPRRPAGASVADPARPDPPRTGWLLRLALWLYRGLLAAALRHPWCVLALVGGVAAVAVGIVAAGGLGSEFFPKIDTGKFSIEIELPAGSSIQRTSGIARQVEQVVARLPASELANYVTTIGETGALNADLRDGGRSGPEYGRVTVELTRRWQRDRSQGQIVAQLRDALEGRVAGAQLSIYERREGPPVGSEIAIRLKHDDLDALAAAAARLETHLRRTPHLIDISNDLSLGRPELRVLVQREVAGLYGITAAQIARAVSFAYQGEKSTQMTIDDDEIDVRVRMAGRARADLAMLARVEVTGAGGVAVPLGELAQLVLAPGLSEIHRHDLDRTATLRCSTTAAVDAADATARLSAHLQSMRAAGELPPGLQIDFGGEREEEEEAIADLKGAMGLSVLLVLALLVFQFNSFRQAAVVLATVPLALIGVVFGLFGLGYKLGFLPFVGVVSLTGIVVNDAIVLVDFANQARARGMDTITALKVAGLTRLRPVLLTTMTTIGGLLPLALNISGGGDFWAPLCWTIISGLIVALGLTLIVVPVLYRLVVR